MIGAGNDAKPGGNAGSAPGFNDAFALPEVFRALVLPDHRIQASAGRRAPGQRAGSPRRRVVETQRVVDRGTDQRPQIEQARNRISGGYETARQWSLITCPVGCQRTGPTMTASGKTAPDGRP